MLLYNIIQSCKILALCIYSYCVHIIFYNDCDAHYSFMIRKITSINILFIKFMQWVSTENLSHEIQELIRTFADDVEYTIDDLDYYGMDELITFIKHTNNDDLIINQTPINAGTIAIIYEGTMNGKNIILKQMRKNIQSELDTSIELLEFITQLCKYIPYINNFRLHDIIRLNKQSIINQSDFKNEVLNMKQYKKNFEGFDDIIIPNCYEYITNEFPIFIIMERINGRKVQELHVDELPSYCITFNNILVESLISRNIVHADLHIGNIFFMEDNKIGVIDFGHILYINDELSKKICKFYKFLFNRQTKKLATFIVNEAIEYNQANCSDEEYEILLSSRKQIVINTLAKSFEEDNILCGSSPINVYNLLDINNMLHDINASMREDFMAVILSFGPFSSVVSILKRNDSNNSLKDVFQSYIKKQIPLELTDYNN